MFDVILIFQRCAESLNTDWLAVLHPQSHCDQVHRHLRRSTLYNNILFVVMFHSNQIRDFNPRQKITNSWQQVSLTSW